MPTVRLTRIHAETPQEVNKIENIFPPVFILDTEKKNIHTLHTRLEINFNITKKFSLLIQSEFLL